MVILNIILAIAIHEDQLIIPDSAKDQALLRRLLVLFYARAALSVYPWKEQENHFLPPTHSFKRRSHEEDLCISWAAQSRQGHTNKTFA